MQLRLILGILLVFLLALTAEGDFATSNRDSAARASAAGAETGGDGFSYRQWLRQREVFTGFGELAGSGDSARELRVAGSGGGSFWGEVAGRARENAEKRMGGSLFGALPPEGELRELLTRGENGEDLTLGEWRELNRARLAAEVNNAPAQILGGAEKLFADALGDAATARFGVVRGTRVDLQSPLGGREAQAGFNAIGEIVENDNHALGWQLRAFASESGGVGGNAGLFSRYAFGGNLFGANVFADFEEDDAAGGFWRWSVGGEWKTRLGDLTANRYFAITEPKHLADNRVAYTREGYDADFAFRIPDAEWAKLRVGYYDWRGKFGERDEDGVRWGVDIDPGEGVKVALEYDAESGEVGGKFLFARELNGKAPSAARAASGFDPRAHFFDVVSREYGQRISKVTISVSAQAGGASGDMQFDSVGPLLAVLPAYRAALAGTVSAIADNDEDVFSASVVSPARMFNVLRLTPRSFELALTAVTLANTLIAARVRVFDDEGFYADNTVQVPVSIAPPLLLSSSAQGLTTWIAGTAGYVSGVGGVAPYRYSLPVAPDAFSIAGNAIVFAGAPDAGVSQLTVFVDDALNSRASAVISAVVENPAPLFVSADNLLTTAPTGFVNFGVLSVSGGFGAYTFNAQTYPAPEGLQQVAQVGVGFGGAVTASASFGGMVTANIIVDDEHPGTDAASVTVTLSFTGAELSPGAGGENGDTVTMTPLPELRLVSSRDIWTITTEVALTADWATLRAEGSAQIVEFNTQVQSENGAGHNFNIAVNASGEEFRVMQNGMGGLFAEGGAANAGTLRFVVAVRDGIRFVLDEPAVTRTVTAVAVHPSQLSLSALFVREQLSVGAQEGIAVLQASGGAGSYSYAITGGGVESLRYGLNGAAVTVRSDKAGAATLTIVADDEHSQTQPVSLLLTVSFTAAPVVEVGGLALTLTTQKPIQPIVAQLNPVGAAPFTYAPRGLPSYLSMFDRFIVGGGVAADLPETVTAFVEVRDSVSPQSAQATVTIVLVDPPQLSLQVSDEVSIAAVGNVATVGRFAASGGLGIITGAASGSLPGAGYDFNDGVLRVSSFLTGDLVLTISYDDEHTNTAPVSRTMTVTFVDRLAAYFAPGAGTVMLANQLSVAGTVVAVGGVGAKVFDIVGDSDGVFVGDDGELSLNRNAGLWFGTVRVVAGAETSFVAATVRILPQQAQLIARDNNTKMAANVLAQAGVGEWAGGAILAREMLTVGSVPPGYVSVQVGGDGAFGWRFDFYLATATSAVTLTNIGIAVGDSLGLMTPATILATANIAPLLNVNNSAVITLRGGYRGSLFAAQPAGEVGADAFGYIAEYAGDDSFAWRKDGEHLLLEINNDVSVGAHTLTANFPYADPQRIGALHPLQRAQFTVAMLERLTLDINHAPISGGFYPGDELSFTLSASGGLGDYTYTTALDAGLSREGETIRWTAQQSGVQTATIIAIVTDRDLPDLNQGRESATAQLIVTLSVNQLSANVEVGGALVSGSFQTVGVATVRAFDGAAPYAFFPLAPLPEYLQLSAASDYAALLIKGTVDADARTVSVLVTDNGAQRQMATVSFTLSPMEGFAATAAQLGTLYNPNYRGVVGSLTFGGGLYAETNTATFAGLTPGAQVDADGIITYASAQKGLHTVSVLVNDGVPHTVPATAEVTVRIDDCLFTQPGCPLLGFDGAYSETIPGAELARDIAETGAPVNIAEQNPPVREAVEGSPLALAASPGNAAALQVMLDYGARANVVTVTSVLINTPLHLAARSTANAALMMQMLISANAHVNTYGEGRNTPLDFVNNDLNLAAVVKQSGGKCEINCRVGDYRLHDNLLIRPISLHIESLHTQFQSDFVGTIGFLRPTGGGFIQDRGDGVVFPLQEPHWRNYFVGGANTNANDPYGAQLVYVDSGNYAARIFTRNTNAAATYRVHYWADDGYPLVPPAHVYLEPTSYTREECRVRPGGCPAIGWDGYYGANSPTPSQWQHLHRSGALARLVDLEPFIENIATPMHGAAAANQEYGVRFLIDNGYDSMLRATTDSGLTPADIAWANNNRFTGIHNIMMQNENALCNINCRAGQRKLSGGYCSPNFYKRSAILFYVRQLRTDEWRSLPQSTCSEHANILFDEYDSWYNGRGPLHAAAIENDIAGINAWLRAGASKHFPADHQGAIGQGAHNYCGGFIPAIDAIRTRNLEALKLLMPNPVNQNDADHCGWTLLDWVNWISDPAIGNYIYATPLRHNLANLRCNNNCLPGNTNLQGQYIN